MNADVRQDGVSGDALSRVDAESSQRVPFSVTTAIWMLPEQYRSTLYALHGIDPEVGRLAVCAILAHELATTGRHVSRARQALDDLGGTGAEPSPCASGGAGG